MRIAHNDFILVSVKVVPNSKKNAVENIVMEGASSLSLKVRITAPPVDGKANQAVVDILSSHFSVRKSDIEILKGATSRQKLIKIYDPTIKMAQHKLSFDQ